MDKRKIIQKANDLILKEFSIDDLKLCKPCKALWQPSANFCGYCGEELSNVPHNTTLVFRTMVLTLPDKKLNSFLKDLDKLLNSYATSGTTVYHDWKISDMEHTGFLTAE